MANEVIHKNRLDLVAGNTSAVDAAESLASSLREAMEQTEDAQQAAASFNAELAKIDRNNQLKRLVTEQVKYAGAIDDSVIAANQLAAELAKIGATQDEITAAAQQFRLEQEKAAQVKPEQLQDTRAGDLSTGLSSLAGAASIGGSNVASQGLQAGADITGAVEYIKVLKANVASLAADAAKPAIEAFTTVKGSLIAAATAASQGEGLFASLAAAALPAITGVGGTAAALGALAVAAAPFVIAAGLAVAAVVSVTNSWQEASEAGHNYAVAVLAGVDAQTQAEQALKNQDASALQDIYTSAFETLDQAEAKAANVKAQLDNAIAEREANRGLFGIATAFDNAQVDEFTKALDEANQQLSEAQQTALSAYDVFNSASGQALILAQQQEEALAAQVDAQREITSLLSGGLGVDALNQKIHDTEEAIKAETVIRDAIANRIGTNNDLYRDSQQRLDGMNVSLDVLRQNSTFTAAAANDVANAEAQRAAAAAKSAAAIQQLNAQEQQLVANANAQAAALRASRDLTDTRGDEDASRAARRAQEDLNSQLEAQAQAHSNRLIQIEADGASKVEDLRDELQDKLVETAAALAEEQARAQKEQIKAQQDFDKQQARQLRDFEIEKARIIEDSGQAQKDALLANDVTSLLRNEAETAKRLARGQQDFTNKTGDQRVDFSEETQARAEASAERLKDIQDELAQFKTSQAEKIAAEQAGIQSRLQAERDGYTQQLVEDEARRAVIRGREEEDASIREARLLQDRQIQDEANANALQQQLDQIEEKRLAEINANDQALDGYTQLNTAATLFNTIASQTLQSIQSAASRASTVAPEAQKAVGGATGLSIPVQPFAEGGYVKATGSPFLALFEGKQNEAVIPLGQSSAGFAGGIVLNINAPVSIGSVGDNVNSQVITSLGEEIVNAIVFANQRLVVGLLNNTR